MRVILVVLVLHSVLSICAFAPSPSAFAPPTLRARVRAPHRSARWASMREETGDSLQELVRRDKLVRQAGLGAGGVLIGAAVLGGVLGGVLDPSKLAPLVFGAALLGALAFGVVYLRNEERGPPLDEGFFAVGEAPGKGQGLFATRQIEEGAYLFDYGGESLDADAFFARYPKGDGLYVAGIHDDLYIDGSDPERNGAGSSALARWMNHAAQETSARPNVCGRKQRVGPNPAMHFYALRPIRSGEELLFDYGDEYWAVLGERPG